MHSIQNNVTTKTPSPNRTSIFPCISHNRLKEFQNRDHGNMKALSYIILK